MPINAKTTRVWPIPRASIPLLARDNEVFTIACYRPSRHTANWTPIRLCSVDLWIAKLTSHQDLAIDIIVGIGWGTSILEEHFVSSDDIPRLDETTNPESGEMFQPRLPLHQSWYGISRGGAGFNSFYGDWSGNQVEVQWERPVIGVCRNRRPLRFRWRKEERPEMHLWNENAAPTIWGIPHFSPASTPIAAVIEGMVTFESEQ
ncbi:MAG: hypothetical protein V1790_14430 [Planctomycetota bacterium]